MASDSQVSETGPAMDAVLDALADKYRRRLLVALLEHNPQDGDPRIPADVEVPDEDVQVLETAMVHTHLPKLEDAGFVEWDEEADEVGRGPRFDEIRPLLQLMHDHADVLPDDWL